MTSPKVRPYSTHNAKWRAIAANKDGRCLVAAVRHHVILRVQQDTGRFMRGIHMAGYNSASVPPCNASKCSARTTQVSTREAPTYAFSHPNVGANWHPCRIMRIAILPPLYSIFSFLCICWPAKAVYFLPWLDTFQAASLVSYFLLLCEYVSPHHEGRDLFFSTVELQDKRAKTQKLDGSQWFRVCSFILS